MTSTYCCVYSVEILLMMDSGLSETCRVLYQINMRNCASCWLSLQEYKVGVEDDHNVQSDTSLL